MANISTDDNETFVVEVMFFMNKRLRQLESDNDDNEGMPVPYTSATRGKLYELPPKNTTGFPIRLTTSIGRDGLLATIETLLVDQCLTAYRVKRITIHWAPEEDYEYEVSSNVYNGGGLQWLMSEARLQTCLQKLEMRSRNNVFIVWIEERPSMHRKQASVPKTDQSGVHGS